MKGSAKRKSCKNTMAFDYTSDAIKKYRDSSVESKLQWISDVNELTYKVLSPKEKRFRADIHKGIIK